jgi:uncharacterized protein YdeI (YjbR/CyaY-like superfamily)
MRSDFGDAIETLAAQMAAEIEAMPIQMEAAMRLILIQGFQAYCLQLFMKRMAEVEAVMSSHAASPIWIKGE